MIQVDGIFVQGGGNESGGNITIDSNIEINPQIVVSIHNDGTASFENVSPGDVIQNVVYFIPFFNAPMPVTAQLTGPQELLAKGRVSTSWTFIYKISGDGTLTASM